MAHRTFSAAKDELLRDRPTFDLQDEKFTCKPAMSIKGLAAAVDALQEAETPSTIQDAALVFFDKVLVKADRMRIRALLVEPDDDDDDAIPVSIKDVTEIVRWLVETYTGNPTQPSSDSGSTPESTGQTLKAVPSIEVSDSAL